MNSVSMKKIAGNIFMNVVCMTVYVFFYSYLYMTGHEETFVAAAMTYGAVVVVANAVYVAVLCRKTQQKTSS